jgi:hypothetical protein
MVSREIELFRVRQFDLKIFKNFVSSEFARKHRKLHKKFRTQEAPGRRCGYLAPHEALVAPWYKIAIDTIGLWEIELQDNETNFMHH